MAKARKIKLQICCLARANTVVERENSPEQTEKQEREENHRFLTPDTMCPSPAIFPLSLSFFHLTILLLLLSHCLFIFFYFSLSPFVSFFFYLSPPLSFYSFFLNPKTAELADKTKPFFFFFFFCTLF